MERVLRAFDLARDGRGRRAYAAWLEARAANDGGKIGEEAMKAIRGGWYLGKETFKDRLLKWLDKPMNEAAGGRRRTGRENRDHGEKEAERIVNAGLEALGFPAGTSGLGALRKSDERKIMLACLLREKTSVSNDWIAKHLHMGHPGSVSRMVSAGRADRKLTRKCNALAKTIARGSEEKP